jgi:hypothetical protein
MNHPYWIEWQLRFREDDLARELTHDRLIRLALAEARICQSIPNERLGAVVRVLRDITGTLANGVSQRLSAAGSALLGGTPS